MKALLEQMRRKRNRPNRSSTVSTAGRGSSACCQQHRMLETRTRARKSDRGPSNIWRRTLTIAKVAKAPHTQLQARRGRLSMVRTTPGALCKVDAKVFCVCSVHVIGRRSSGLSEFLSNYHLFKGSWFISLPNDCYTASITFSV